MPTLRSLPALALAALLATPAAATTISFQNGFDGYAGADNESYSFDGTVNQDQIRVDLPSASQPAGSYAWIVFADLFGDGAVPSGATIVSATLEGLVRNPFGAATLTRLLADVASRPFGAGASVLDAAGSFFDDTQLVSAAHPACGDAVECVPPVPVAWDVTAIVQAWANGAANHGFLLLPETTNGGKLFATDDPDPALRPRLVITYDDGGITVPEPALLALLGLALTPALRRRS
jgi:MYXO-CTERM domain-containing protein